MNSIYLNNYGEITTAVNAFYRLSETDYKIAMTMLSQIESIREVVESESGTLTLCFEKNKCWCEVDGYPKEKADVISNTLNGAVVFEYGEYVSTITYYQNKVMLYIVGSMFVEVFYDQSENNIIQIHKLDLTHPRLSLYSKDVNISNLNT